MVVFVVEAEGREVLAAADDAAAAVLWVVLLCAVEAALLSAEGRGVLSVEVRRGVLLL